MRNFLKQAVLTAFTVLLFSNVRAQLKLDNATCNTIKVTVMCHDANYTTCRYILSQQFTIGPYSSLTFANTSSLGVCYLSSPGYPTYTPQNTQNWDDCIVSLYNGTTTYAKGSMGCGGTEWHDPDIFSCAGYDFGVQRIVSGSLTVFYFTYF